MTVTSAYIYGMLSGGMMFAFVGFVLELIYPPKCRWCKRKIENNQN